MIKREVIKTNKPYTEFWIVFLEINNSALSKKRIIKSGNGSINLHQNLCINYPESIKSRKNSFGEESAICPNIKLENKFYINSSIHHPQARLKPWNSLVKQYTKFQRGFLFAQSSLFGIMNILYHEHLYIPRTLFNLGRLHCTSLLQAVMYK